MNKNRKKIIALGFVLVLSLGLMGFFAFSLVSEVLMARQGREFYAALPVEFVPRVSVQPIVNENTRLIDAVEGKESEIEATPFVSFVDFDEKREMFPSIVGWIQSEGTIINYPIVQGRDNDFYLHRLPDGTRHQWGSIFLDYRNSYTFLDMNIFIYGHNMRSGDMFGTLKYYECQEYFEQHPSMFIFTPRRNFILKLFAGYVIPDSRVEQPPQRFVNLPHFESFIEDIRARSIFDADIEVNFGDTLVFLCTCTEGGSVHERLIIVGKLIEI